MPAVLILDAVPPTNNPILKIESSTSRYAPRKVSQLPSIRYPKNSAAAAYTSTREITDARA
ncbi:hypothetical protein D3C75_1348150 [compost metagenome]